MGKVQSIFTVDSHTQGEPTRIIVGGIPYVSGKSMDEKRENFRKNHDNIRKALMCEPRGHRDMFGCILTDPVSQDGHFGMIFMDNEKYLNMCGHGTIGVGATLVETGMVDPKIQKEINIDSPAGLVRLKTEITDDKVQRVCFKNVPSFVEVLDEKVVMPGYGEITYDISFGGNYFALVRADQFNVKVAPENTSLLKKIGMELRAILNKKHKIQHPTLEYINTIDIVTFLDDPHHPKAAYKNVHIFSDSQADRSPGGTGTTAVLTMMHAKQQIELNQEIFSEGLVGGIFRGKVLEKTQIGHKSAVSVEICGTANITGYHHFVIDSEDKLGEGFIIS